MIKINHNEAEGTNNKKEFTLLPEGTEVEVFATDFEPSVSVAGNNMVAFTYKIRDDIDQEGKGRELRYDRFVETEKALWRIQAASKAAQLENGREYASLEEWAKALVGKSIRLVVGIDEYNGKERNVVKGFRVSEVGGEMAEEKAPEIDSDDLPF